MVGGIFLELVAQLAEILDPVALLRNGERRGLPVATARCPASNNSLGEISSDVWALSEAA